MSEKRGHSMEIILSMTLILIVLVLINLTTNVIKSYNPEIFNNCVKSTERIGFASGTIASRIGAERALGSIVEGPLKFTNNNINTCGTGYVFLAGAEKYIVCENGDILRYIVVCGNETLYEKTKESVFIMRNAPLSKL